MCAFSKTMMENNWLTQIWQKMMDFLVEGDAGAYGNQYLKDKQEEHFGGSIFITVWRVAWCCKVARKDKIHAEWLFQYAGKWWRSPEERHRWTCSQTYQEQYQVYIILSSNDEYPKTSSLELQFALHYFPLSLRRFIGKIALTGRSQALVKKLFRAM